ncbi:MAG: tetratricopeptide repeat protein, partial [Candidatus Omnitrophica bacterium]|nr:tetratricopeptide repeat protein [Candidatus Omnitrophota bacterium]
EDTRMRDQNLLQATVYVNKGMRHLDNREFKQAVIEYTEAIKLDKSDPKVYYYRGLANMMQNESDNALTDFSKAIQMNPNLAEAYNNRAVIYLSKKGYKKCEEDINKAEELGYKINPKLIEELNKARAQK